MSKQKKSNPKSLLPAKSYDSLQVVENNVGKIEAFSHD